MNAHLLRQSPELISQANRELPLNLFQNEHQGILAARWRHKDCWLPVHNAAQQILCYHENGSTQVNKFERGKRVAGHSDPKTLTFIPCDGTEWEITGECQVVHIYLDRKIMAELIQQSASRDMSVEPFFSVRDAWLERYFNMLLAECELYGKQIDSLLLGQSQVALASHLFKFYGYEEADRQVFERDDRQSISPARLRAVLDFIEANYAREISLKELAKEACLSEFHFARCFKNALGTSPYRFVVQRRLVAAAALLTNSRLPIQVIAQAVGFPSTRHFSTSFKSWSGKTPKDYRHH